MFTTKKLLVLLFTTAFILNGVNASRYIPKSDSDYINPEPPVYGRDLDGYSPQRSNYTITLRGSAELGYYYANFFFGYPPQKETVIIDTGSSITAVPCQTCTHCGTTHWDAEFNTRESQSYSDVACNAKIENFDCTNCVNSDCLFYIGYSEGSYYNGTLGSDMMTAGDDIEALFYGESQKTAADILQEVQNKHVQGYFGCVSQEGGLFKTQSADGILGLGLKTNTPSVAPNYIDILAETHGDQYRNAFSVCLSANGGYLTLGGQSEEYLDPNGTPIIVKYSNYGQYYIGFYGISVTTIAAQTNLITIFLQLNGTQVTGQSDIDDATGMFVDSGTTMLYVTSAIYKQVTDSLNIFCSQNSSSCGAVQSQKVGSDLCYRRDTDKWPNLNDFLSSFPTFDFALDNNQTYPLTGFEYLFPKEDGNEDYCLGIYDDGKRIVFGGIFMKNHDFHFDKDNQMITITKADCGARMATAPSGQPVPINWGI